MACDGAHGWRSCLYRVRSLHPLLASYRSRLQQRCSGQQWNAERGGRISQVNYVTTGPLPVIVAQQALRNTLPVAFDVTFNRPVIGLEAWTLQLAERHQLRSRDQVQRMYERHANG